MEEKQVIPSTLIIVPTYNVLENLPRVVKEIQTYLPSADILVVDDQSPDGTGQLADEMQAQNPKIFVLHRKAKEGLGKAYIAGFQWALSRDYELIFEMDADLSHPASALPRFIEASKTADVVLGSRWTAGGGVSGWPLKRKMISQGGSLYARGILGVGIKDLTGGFKCFHRRVLEQIGLEQVVTVGYGFQIELTWRALQKGFTVVEIPILFTDRILGKSKMSGAIFMEALSLVWKLKLGLIK
jgi:dolichol-phosphate mannosyltransferase